MLVVVGLLLVVLVAGAQVEIVSKFWMQFTVSWLEN
jgi:hypothetical protein